MRARFLLAALPGAAALVAALCLPGPAGADPPASSPRGPFGGHWLGRAPVFVQTNDPSGNQIVSYLPTGSGLREVSRVDTGGDGTSIAGSVVDKLASQGSLADDPADQLLVAVNGGSNSITVFHTFGPYLGLRRVLPSGGSTPVSVTVRGDLLYVLDAGGTGAVQGYDADTLTPIPGSNQSLGLDPTLTPAYLNTPGQIGFTPDGRHLVVTTKANGSDIDVFDVTPGGGLSGGPTVNPSATPVPFGFSFDRRGDLVVTEAGTSNLTTYRLGAGDRLTELGTVSNGLSALCWVTGTWQGVFFGANAGSASITGYTIDPHGVPEVVSTTPTDAGPIDVVASPDGSTLYVETGGSDLVDVFSIQAHGSLVPVGSVAPEPSGHSGLEGIAVG
jgi:DNA-binding beta-propeller fold protein YncE